ncbi:uncharacterized protein PV09_06121 [Verruconis gallopava]|uniref:Rab-GAP TBC domain-containing protein n=1 Tax=Verruconis gallopava TaxID=253628 RepID=A0A0D2AU65_9PEZI|nr:uncharacterized protein PV09_06121 [Verruconis gallopava]KIW02684.1 hypothetical protein PV09_06121 [Verruconis gallopava]
MAADEAGNVLSSATLKPSLNLNPMDVPHNESSENVKIKAKRERILSACETKNLDLLIELASEDGGFLSDDIRQKAWPILLGSDHVSTAAETEAPWETLPPHRDEEQVRLDVHRSFIYYPSNETDKQLDARRVDLEALIVSTLRRHPSLCYFQGYHDICQVFLLVNGLPSCYSLVRRLSMLRIRDFMLPKLSASVSHLRLLPAILYAADRPIYAILPANPFYGLSHVLTLYAHDIHSYSDIARLFDFLLAREAVMSIYLFAVIIISKREMLLEYMADEPDENILAVVLQKLPQDIDIEGMICQAIKLYEQFPPASLPFKTWKMVSDNSVLKTTIDRKALRDQTLQEGQVWFDNHAEEIRREEFRAKVVMTLKNKLSKYRRPALFTLSVAVCALALWAGKNKSSPFGGLVNRMWDVSTLGKYIDFVGRYREL